MRLVRLLPERWQKLLHEGLKFGTVGALNLVVNFAVFNALIFTVFPTGQLKANVIATLVALTVSFFMNRHWTYRDRPKSAVRREYMLFFLFNGVGLAIELGVLGLTKYGLGLETVLAINAAKVVGTVLGTVFRFWSYRTFVFKPERVIVAASPAATAPAATVPVATVPVAPAATRPAARTLPRRLPKTPIDLELEVELAAAELRPQSTRAD
jgi:putative flippase GtrA